MKFLLGSDPELMLRSTETDSLKSSIPIFRGSKAAGAPVAGGLGAVLSDNVLTEFNTQPARSIPEFIETTRAVLKAIAEEAHAAGCKLTVQASAEFPEAELSDPAAHVFGCEPDYDAWQLEVNDPPRAAVNTFRSAGGHLHIGMGEDERIAAVLDSPYGKAATVRALDIFCGIPSVFLDKDPTSPARRSLYGKAGSHRPKSYGVEYRAMSPWWLATPKHTQLVCKLAEVAVTVVSADQVSDIEENGGAGTHLQNLVLDIAAVRGVEVSFEAGSNEIRRIINQSDTKAALDVFVQVITSYIDSDLKDLVHEVYEMGMKNFYDAWDLQ